MSIVLTFVIERQESSFGVGKTGIHLAKESRGNVPAPGHPAAWPAGPRYHDRALPRFIYFIALRLTE